MQEELGKVKKIHRKKILFKKIDTVFKHLQKLSPKHYAISLLVFLFSFSFLIPYYTSISANFSLTSVSASGEVLGADLESSFIEGYGLTDIYVHYEEPASSKVLLKDKRAYVLDQYFKSRNSPLYGYGKTFVEACDRYGAPKDCISTTAIARHETDLCNYANSASYFNCMGWGGGGIHRIKYNSFEDHINIATDILVNQYGPEYMDDPRLMEGVFCGPQEECYGWGNRILFFMREIDNFSESLGVGRLTDLRDDGLRY